MDHRGDRRERIEIPFYWGSTGFGSVTVLNFVAAIASGATDVFRLAALIRACRLLPDGRWITAARKPDVADVPPVRMSPTGRGAHPWHQISINSHIMGTHFQVKAGIQAFLYSVPASDSDPRSTG